MSAVPDIEDHRRARLRNLIAQMGLSRAEAAALLRLLAEDLSPSERYRRLQAVQPQETTPPRSTAADPRAAARKRRYRQRRKAELRVLRCYPSVSDEHVAILVQRGLIPASATESDAELVEALERLIHELAEVGR